MIFRLLTLVAEMMSALIKFDCTFILPGEPRPRYCVSAEPTPLSGKALKGSRGFGQGRGPC